MAKYTPAQTKYYEKFKDPRWQKKRLEVLQRDEFMCQICLDTSSTLHIHHRRYISNTEPWEYSNELLVTLCERCHEGETEQMNNFLQKLNDVLKTQFFSDDIIRIMEGFCGLKISYPSEVMASIINFGLKSNKVMQYMDKEFWNYNKKKMRAKNAKKIH
jgi:hypothetical protein